MPRGQLFPLVTQPGIKRDGTQFLGKWYIDGQWVRFYRGRARKIGGYKQIIGGLPNIPRGVFVTPSTPNFDVYIGDQNTLNFFQMDQNGNAISGLNNITPAGFNPDADNLWQFDEMFSTVSNESILIAHAAPNASFIGSTVERPVYYGPIDMNTPLISTGQDVSGGIVVLHPYLFMFGNSGDVRWSAANDPTTILGTARIASEKIVYGSSTRGGNSSPAGLLWTLTSLIKVTQVGTTDILFKFDTVTDQSSILSSRSVIEYDGLYFWAGIDRFLVYNGVVQEVPNQMNLNYFFLNLNYQQRQKVWATKVPQYGEIWWFFPLGNSVECNHAIIYNKRENTWYDTSITRGSGYFEQVFADPIWADTSLINGNYTLWQHESGVDQRIGNNLTAIDSFFETGDLAFVALGPTGSWTGDEIWIDLYRLEPDFIQAGAMSLVINGREYARSLVQSSIPYPFDPATTKIDLREQRREMTLRFESNVVGGFYELGETLLYFRTGDVRA
jgi:hypothetical protein